MTVSSTLEATLRGRAASRRRRARPPRCSGIAEFEDDLAHARFTTSRTGATAPAGASCAACSAPPACRRRAPRRPTARRSGAARAVTLPALDVAPPFVFWGKEEVAIDVFHHLVYAVATGAGLRARRRRPAQRSRAAPVARRELVDERVDALVDRAARGVLVVPGDDLARALGERDRRHVVGDQRAGPWRCRRSPSGPCRRAASGPSPRRRRRSRRTSTCTSRGSAPAAAATIS